MYSPVGHFIYRGSMSSNVCVSRRIALWALLIVTSNRSATERCVSWLAIAHKTSKICFSGGTGGRPKGLACGNLPVTMISRAWSSNVYLVIRKWLLNSQDRYEGIVFSKKPIERFKLFRMKVATIANTITLSSLSVAIELMISESSCSKAAKTFKKPSMLNVYRLNIQVLSVLALFYFV